MASVAAVEFKCVLLWKSLDKPKYHPDGELGDRRSVVPWGSPDHPSVAG